MIGVGVPVEHGDWSFLSSCGCPKIFFHSTNDQYGRRPTMEKVFGSAAGPKSIEWVEASDHFFADALDELEKAVLDAVTSPV